MSRGQKRKHGGDDDPWAAFEGFPRPFLGYGSRSRHTRLTNEKTLAEHALREGFVVRDVLTYASVACYNLAPRTDRSLCHEFRQLIRGVIEQIIPHDRETDPADVAVLLDVLGNECDPQPDFCELWSGLVSFLQEATFIRVNASLHAAELQDGMTMTEKTMRPIEFVKRRNEGPLFTRLAQYAWLIEPVAKHWRIRPTRSVVWEMRDRRSMFLDYLSHVLRFWESAGLPVNDREFSFDESDVCSTILKSGYHLWCSPDDVGIRSADNACMDNHRILERFQPDQPDRPHTPIEPLLYAVRHGFSRCWSWAPLVSICHHYCTKEASTFESALIRFQLYRLHAENVVRSVTPILARDLIPLVFGYLQLDRPACLHIVARDAERIVRDDDLINLRRQELLAKIDGINALVAQISLKPSVATQLIACQ